MARWDMRFGDDGGEGEGMRMVLAVGVGDDRLAPEPQKTQDFRLKPPPPILLINPPNHMA